MHFVLQHSNRQVHPSHTQVLPLLTPTSLHQYPLFLSPPLPSVTHRQVVDNEAFYTPAHTSFPAASPSPAPFLGTFTPGPEAAALAAALAAGMAVPSKSGQVGDWVPLQRIF